MQVGGCHWPRATPHLILEYQEQQQTISKSLPSCFLWKWYFSRISVYIINFKWNFAIGTILGKTISVSWDYFIFNNVQQAHLNEEMNESVLTIERIFGSSSVIV